MDKSKLITQHEFSELCDDVLYYEKKSIVIKRKARFCAIIGHIAFNLVLGVIGFLLSLFMVEMDEGLTKRPWFSELSEKISSLLEGTEGLIYVGIMLLSLIVVPFLLCAFSKLFFFMFNSKRKIKTSKPISKTLNLENAKRMKYNLKQIESDAETVYWRNNYPLFEMGDTISINAYNFIPWLSLAIPIILGGVLGTTASRMVIYVGLVLLALLISFIALIITVPLWKLSSIINSVFYKNLDEIYTYSTLCSIERYIEANTPKKEDANVPTYGSYSGGYSSDPSWSAEHGLNTYYTDSRNGQKVFYKDGEYKNEDGERVPIQWMV